MQSIDSIVEELSSQGIPVHLLAPLKSTSLGGSLNDEQYAEILRFINTSQSSSSSISTTEQLYRAMYLSSQRKENAEFLGYVQVQAEDGEDFELLEATGFETACRERMQVVSTDLPEVPFPGAHGTQNTMSVVIADSASRCQQQQIATSPKLNDMASDGSTHSAGEAVADMDRVSSNMALEEEVGAASSEGSGGESGEDEEEEEDTSSDALISLILAEDLRDYGGFPPNPALPHSDAMRKKKKRKKKARGCPVAGIVQYVQKDLRSLEKTVKSILSK
eukprot:gene29961-36185_t